MHWWLKVYKPNGRGDENTSYETWKTWNNAPGQHFRHVRSSGYFPDTGQAVLELVCYASGHPFDDVVPVLAELELWRPDYLPIPDKDGRPHQHFQIFEHTLAENGVYALHLYGPDDVELRVMRYYHEHKLHRFALLSDALAYVAEHHYYEKVGGI